MRRSTPRRPFVVAASALLAAVHCAACSTEVSVVDAHGDETTRVGGIPTPPPEWDRPVTRPQSEGAALSARDRCAFHRGALPAETLAPAAPLGDDIPIRTIVVLMMENRSFDSYFGKLGEFTGRHDVTAPPRGASVPVFPLLPSSPRVPWQHAPAPCGADMPHEWEDMHRSWHFGKMDGFVASADGRAEGHYPSDAFLGGERAMWFYDQRDIPFYYALASTFSIADRYFAPIIGPTIPNRDYLYAGSSYGETADGQVGIGGHHFPSYDLVVFDELEKRHVSWRIYKDGIAAGLESTLSADEYYLRYGALEHPEHFQGTDEFFEDARAGKLPQVVFVDPNLLGGTPAAFHLPYDWENDEHPPSDLQKGQAFSAKVVRALMNGPQWPHAALFLTWDEAGGFYDHVAPPRACPPDDIEPRLETAAAREFPGRFDRYGFRVPTIVVSPYAKPSFVSHVTYDHTSILRFIEARHALPALTGRDANADPMFDMFDFAHPRLLTPPQLPSAVVDADAFGKCRALYRDVK